MSDPLRPESTVRADRDETIPTAGPEHWIVEAARTAGLTSGKPLSVPRGSALAEAWSRAARALDLSLETVARHVADHFGLKLANLEGFTPSAQRLLPLKVARRHGVFPLRMDDRQFVVATADPTDHDAEKDIAFACGRTPVFEVVPPQAIEAAVAAAYGLDAPELGEASSDEVARAVEVVEELGPEKLDAQDVDTRSRFMNRPG